MSRRVLSFHYDLTNRTGEPLDSSRKGEPFFVMEGSRQILPGLEEALFKMKLKEKQRVELPAAQAYGLQDQKLKLKVSREKLPAGDLKVGIQFRGGNDEHAPLFTVTQIEGNDVFLDGNHPLAGVDLVFDVEVMEIREATAEELTHGHAHGPHGHSH